MVRVALLFAACVAAAASGVVHAETEAEAARVRVVLRVHEHGKSVSDTIGDVWDTVKNETSDAIESVADELHDALYGSGSNDAEDEPVEIVVVKQTVLKNKVVASNTIVRHYKEGEEEGDEGEDVIDEIENALFGSSSSSASGSGSNATEATEVGDEEEGSTKEELTEEEEGSQEEEADEGNEIIDLPMPPPEKKHHKKKHHAAKHQQAKKHHHAKKHHEAKKHHVKEEVKTVQKETNTMAKATDAHSARRPETTFALIGAAVGAMVGIVALAVFVTVRRRRSASSASVLATHESDVEAIAQEEEEEDVEDAAAPVAEDLEKGDAKTGEALEGSV